MLKKLLNLSLLALMILTLGGCSKDEDDVPDEWTKGSDFEGIPRSAASSFTIDGRTYVVGGFDGEKRLNDMWYYDNEKSNWFRVLNADFPGRARNYAVAFVINGKAYVGAGSDGSEAKRDFYQFDPVTNKWTPIPDFPGEARYGAVAFSGNGKGFVGMGTNTTGDLKDFYSYTPGLGTAPGTWAQVNSLPSTKRANAFTFTIGDLAYIGGGRNNGIYLTDFWSFNTKTGEWNSLNALDRDDNGFTYNLKREYAATFLLGGQAYITGGSSGSILSSTWQYNPDVDGWYEYQNFGGTAREAAIGFSIGDRGYVTTGRNGSLRFDDMWIFKPND